MYFLDPSLQDQAVDMATKIDNDTEGVTLNVSGLDHIRSEVKHSFSDWFLYRCHRNVLPTLHFTLIPALHIQTACSLRCINKLLPLFYSCLP